MKNFKRILALSLTLVILSTFTACQLFASEGGDPTTNLSLEELLTATDDNGVVTDFEGNTLENVDANEELNKFGDEQEVISQEGVATTKAVSTTKKNDNSSTGTTKNNSSSGNNSGEGATLPPASNFNTLYQEFFSKGIFTLEGTLSAVIDGETLYMPFMLGLNGKERYVKAQFTEQGRTVSLIMNNQKTYMLLPTLKIYIDTGESALGEIGFSGLTGTSTHSSTKKVKIGDDIYICEERKDNLGNSTYFYFLDGQLSRIKFEDETGVSLLKVDNLKPVVDKADFAVPAGYKKLNDIKDIKNLEDILG